MRRGGWSCNDLLLQLWRSYFWMLRFGGCGVANWSLGVWVFGWVARRVWKACCGGYWMRYRSSATSVTRIVCLRRDGVIAEISGIARAEFSSLGKCNNIRHLSFLRYPQSSCQHWLEDERTCELGNTTTSHRTIVKIVVRTLFVAIISFLGQVIFSIS